jgi:hypothetical protein
MAALRRLWHFGFMWMSLHEQMNILSGLKSTAVLSLLPMVSDKIALSCTSRPISGCSFVSFRAQPQAMRIHR